VRGPIRCEERSNGLRLISASQGRRSDHNSQGSRAARQAQSNNHVVGSGRGTDQVPQLNAPGIAGIIVHTTQGQGCALISNAGYGGTNIVGNVDGDPNNQDAVCSGSRVGQSDGGTRAGDSLSDERRAVKSNLPKQRRRPKKQTGQKQLAHGVQSSNPSQHWKTMSKICGFQPNPAGEKI